MAHVGEDGGALVGLVELRTNEKPLCEEPQSGPEPQGERRPQGPRPGKGLHEHHGGSGGDGGGGEVRK